MKLLSFGLDKEPYQLLCYAYNQNFLYIILFIYIFLLLILLVILSSHTLLSISVILK